MGDRQKTGRPSTMFNSPGKAKTADFFPPAFLNGFSNSLL
jgi:hypothetical protein